MAIGVAELKARLSGYLAKVKAGEELLITERGRPIARLVPVRAAEELRDARRQRLLRSGVLVPRRGPIPRSLLEGPPRRGEPAGVLEALLDERDRGR